MVKKIVMKPQVTDVKRLTMKKKLVFRYDTNVNPEDPKWLQVEHGKILEVVEEVQEEIEVPTFETVEMTKMVPHEVEEPEDYMESIMVKEPVMIDVKRKIKVPVSTTEHTDTKVSVEVEEEITV
jgi:hypothetical protein